MSGFQHSTFACTHCGKQIVWSARLAGARVKCTCGHQVTAPATAPAAVPEDTYDLVDDELLEELPSTDAPPQHRQELNYESKELYPPRTIKNLAKQADAGRLVLPVVAIVLGIAFRLVLPLFLSSAGGTVRTGAGLALILLAVLINVTTMLVGVGIVAKLTGAELASGPLTLLKLCAIAVFGSVIFAGAASFDRGDGFQGMVVAWHVVVLFNWVMFTMLFEFDLQESLFAVALVGILQAIAACGLGRG